jgi:hypothetical protein
MRPALTAKRVEILKEIAPFATRLAALFNPTEPAVRTGMGGHGKRGEGSGTGTDADRGTSA